MAYGIKTSLDLNSMKLVKTQFSALLLDMQNLANKNVVGIKVGNLNGQLSQSSNILQGMNGHTRSLGESMSYATGQVVKFGIGMTAVYGTVKLVKDGLKEISDINMANTNVAMITNTDVKDVEKMNGTYLQMAKNLKVANSEILSGSEAWLRSGVNQETANKNLETTTKLSKIAGVSNSEMADSLITISNQYKMNSNDLEEYASRVAMLDNLSATSAEKINSAMQYSAETMKSMGISTDTALSYITNYSEKSAQSGETIGRTFKSMLLNFQKMKLGFKSGDETEVGAVNKLETLLNSKGVTLRKNKDEWNDLDDVITKIQQNMSKFTEVQKSDLAFKIGGKEQAEATLSTLNNMKRINELQKKLKEDDGAQAMANSYAKYLTSIEASKANFKNTMTELYEKTISSDALKSGIDVLIQAVQLTGFLITDAKTLIATFVGLVLVIKNFGALALAIGNVSTFLGFLKTDGLGALAVLNFNPVSISLITLTALFGAITYEKYKDAQQTKDLTRDYNNLKKAMDSFDTKGIVEGTVKIKEQQKEIDRLKKLAGNKTDMGFGVKDDSGQRDLDKYIKSLREAGYVINTNTNKIINLKEAESRAHTTSTIQKIRDKTNATVEDASATQSLIQQYLSLNGQENKSEAQKKILSNLTKELTGSVSGLTTKTDEHGNMVITNCDFLGKQVSALDLVRQQSVITANQEIKSCIASTQIMHDGTIMTLKDMKTKVEGYQALNKALAGTDAGKSGFFKTIIDTNNAGAKDLQKSIDDITTMQDAMSGEFVIDTPALSSNSTSTTGDGKGYKATDEEDKANDKADKAKSKAETLANKRKAEAEKARQLTHDNAVAKAEEKVALAERRVVTAKTESQKKLAEGALKVANAELKAVKLIGATQAETSQARIESIRFETANIVEMQKKASDAIIAGYQKQIDMINKKSEAEDKTTQQLKFQADLLEQKKDLETAENQKNVEVINSKGKWEWRANTEAIKTAKEALKNTQDEFAKWKSDNAKDAKIDHLNVLIKAEQDKQSRITGYASGTKDAEAGVKEINEEGIEVVVGNKARFQGGERVINAPDTKSMLNSGSLAISNTKASLKSPTKVKASTTLATIAKNDSKVGSAKGKSKADEAVRELLDDIDTTIDKFVTSSPKYSENLDTNIGSAIASNAPSIKNPLDTLIKDLDTDIQRFVDNSPSYGRNTDNNIGNAITTNSALTTIPMSTLITKLQTGIDSFVKGTYKSGTGITTEMGKGVTEGSKTMEDIVNKLTAKIISLFNTGFGIASPSKVMYKIGGFLMEGLINGMTAADIEGFITSKIGSMTTAAGGVMGSSLVTEAMKYLGTPYVWGGAAPGGFDCSGLVQYVYKQLGVDIGRTTYDQVKNGTAVKNKKDLKPGDIVFFGYPGSPHHEGMYIGGGKFIQAPATGQNVKITDLNSRSDYAGARRIIQEPTGGAGGNLDNWIKQAMLATGTSMSNFANLKSIAMHESSGNPKDINKYDSNWQNGHPSKGLMQMIDESFKENMLKGHGDIMNPVDNTISAIRYMIKRYGSISNVPGIKSMANGGAYKGYAVGSRYVPKDIITKVHEGEMITPKSENPYANSGGRVMPKFEMPNVIIPKFEMPEIKVNSNIMSSGTSTDKSITIQKLTIVANDPDDFFSQLKLKSRILAI